MSYQNQKLTGMALYGKEAASGFEDSDWEPLFDALIRLTQRTSLIVELTGTNLKIKTLKAIMDRKFRAVDERPNRPRGVGKDKSCTSLLQTVHERFDASYLIGLHFGILRDGQIETETNYQIALQKRIEVFHRYRADCYQGGETRLSFEYYITLIQGVKERNIATAICTGCGAQHVFNSTSLDIPKCPVCTLLELNMGQAEQQMQQRISGQASRRYGAVQ